MKPVDEKNDSFDFRNSGYFASLPPFVQESLMQSAGLINDEESLKQAAENILNRQQF